MGEPEVSKALLSADARCRTSGARLTEKRKRALTVLLKADTPISAYELIDEYQQAFGESLTAMSAYRMLNFLVEQNLAHKLQTVAKYTVCKHIACDHAHEQQQFLICDNCESVEEIDIGKNVLKGLKQSLAQTGFRLDDQQLELHGICEKCL